jgi:2-C-methyl-D-erythritol 2,4-cyclodiphosphate synthase
MFKIGIGYDIHSFSEQSTDYIILGGIKIPYTKLISAHSDGDVLLHSLTDAILGAIAEGSIGVRFPNTDDRWKNASSSEFIKYSYDLALKKGYKISNIDVTVICQEPKIMPHAVNIRENISTMLKIDIDQINIKAVTPEGLGSLGRREGIACQAAILLIKRYS